MDERISQAVKGNQEALGGLLFDHHDQLLEFLSRKMSTRLRALLEPEDILQQTFVEAFRSIGSYRPKSERAFLRWLQSIAENRLVDAARAQDSKKRGGEFRRVTTCGSRSPQGFDNLLDHLSDGGTTPASEAARREGVQALKVHLARLPEKHRVAMTLRHLQGLSLQEVADQMNCSPGEIRGILYRARKNLRDALGQTSLYFSGK